MKKEALSMNEFLLKIKINVDRLASMGNEVYENDYIEAISYGLTGEYDTFMVFVNSKADLNSLKEIESFLLAQEPRIEKNKKDFILILKSTKLLVSLLRNMIEEVRTFLVVRLILVEVIIHFLVQILRIMVVSGKEET